MYAGGVVRTANQNYYLYTDCMYWTMSPSYFDTNGHAYVFSMDYNGNPGSGGVNGGVPGVRPVINLRSDVTISSGNGTSANPYVIN